MKDEKSFILNLDTMPKATAQQKGVYVRNGKPHFYEKSSIEGARRIFTYALKPHAPQGRSVMPIKLYIWFVFDIKDKAKWGKYKTTKPDTDNYLKLFKDCMTDVGFWIDDSQVVDEHCVKTYGEKASIFVRWQELGDRP